MIRWALRDDACGDAFVDFCRETALVDRHRNVNRYWEYPWAYFHSGLRPGMRVLDAGTGYSSFLQHLQQRIPDARYHAADPCFQWQEPKQLRGVALSTAPLERLDYPDAHFDLIFCLSVLEHLLEPAQVAAIGNLARCLRPGGRLVLTLDYFLDWPRWHAARERKRQWYAWLPNDGNVNVAALVRASGLELNDPGRVDDHPGTGTFAEETLDVGRLWSSAHVGPGLRAVPVGVVLYKPYPPEVLAGMRLAVAPQARHLLDDGTPMVGLHFGVGADPSVERLALPPEAADPAGFTVTQLAGWLGPERATAVARFGLRWGALVPAEPGGSTWDSYHGQTFRLYNDNPAR
ncbi:class I SAM-dependent methyltransferase [Rhizomonospora bruguierae]|uniref:class I SAM-dependent methyltransferase n=1 Tax=Rhizomonospora bruguierae TaxID=1581705 RepID=UPI001BCAC701|nr:class I SAM-dependent methyltransferase [Micromonospora sp. NBRC 107566]